MLSVLLLAACGPSPAQPEACARYVACAEAEARMGVQQAIDRYGDGGSCFEEADPSPTCEAQCTAEAAALVELNDGDVADVCWTGNTCETVTYAHVRCPDAILATGPLVCASMDTVGEACVAEAVETCGGDAGERVATCLGLEPGTFARAVGDYAVVGTSITLDSCDAIASTPLTEEDFVGALQIGISLSPDGELSMNTFARTPLECTGSGAGPWNCTGRVADPASTIELDLTWSTPTAYTGVYTVTLDSDACQLGIAIEGTLE